MYDIIIIGAGTAGCYLARLLDPNLNVLIIEKDKKVKLKDSGIVSTRFTQFFSSKFIKERIKQMTLVSPSNLSYSISSEKPFAYVLKRKEFAQALRSEARKKAKIVYEEAQEIDISKNVKVRTNKNDYECKLIVGADGANSVVRKALGIKPPRCCTGIMVKNRSVESNIRIFFNKYFSPEFFAWIKNEEYGLMTATRPPDYLNYFREQQELPKGKLYAAQIPIGYTKSFSKHAILIGDACGQVKPVTGGGIILSAKAANHAASVIENAIRKNNFSTRTLYEYEKSWKDDFGWEIRKQLLIRKIYRKLSNKDIEQILKDFMPSIEQTSFDYDYLSNIWKSIPTIKLIKHVITKLPLLF